MNRSALLLTLAFVAIAPVRAQVNAPRLDALARTHIADSAAQIYSTRYPEASTGQLLADSLRNWARRDRWRTDTTPELFSASLQREVRAIVNDRHLWYRYEPAVEYVREALGNAAPAVQAGAGQVVRRTGRVDSRDSLTVARTNFGFARAERLDGNVGYIKIDQFVPLDWSRESATAALAFVRHTSALIIDVRGNRGGSPDLVAWLLSHFVPAPPQLLHASYHRVSGRADSVMSVASLPGPRRVGQALYVLTDRRSASAAEMLPYVVQRMGLGIIVGERTAGAGNGGTTFSLGQGISLFSPERRVLTGPGWEGTGVTPHVEVAPEEALARALSLHAARAAAPGETMSR